MARINMGKVVVAGLLAGLVLNVGDFLINAVFMAADFQATATRLGLDPAALESGSVIATWVIVDFVMGIVLVWNYAAVRPRFGAGPATAILGALAPFLAVTLVMLGFTGMGFFTMTLFVKSTLFSAINFAIGAVAGAWLYSE